MPEPARFVTALQHIRNAQWYWDYAAAGHGSAFQSPVEVSRIIGLTIAESNEARVMLARVLAKHGKNEPVAYPDIETKQKAHSFIALEMAKLQSEKAGWIKTILPEWNKKAQEREDSWPTQKEKEE